MTLRSASAPAFTSAPGPASTPTSASASTSFSALRHKMGLVDLPVELLVLIIDYIIPENWKYYSEARSILKLRLLCSKPLSHFAASQLKIFRLFQNCFVISFRTVHSAN